LEVLKLLSQLKTGDLVVLRQWASLGELGELREQNFGYVEETAKFVKHLIVVGRL
jgi:hypothetical protein